MSTHEPRDDKRAIWIGIAVMIFLMVLAGEAFAAQPAVDATASEHLYFLAHLAVVIFGFLIVLFGAAHGYAMGAKNDAN